MKPTCEELELHLEESQREFRAADATIHNLDLKITDMAVQLANAESKCRELAVDNEKAMDSLKQADSAVKLAHEKFSALADENMALKSGHYNGMILPETTATDTFLAEVRAHGVEMAMEHMQLRGSLTFGDCYISLNEFAAKLRQEEAQ